MMQKTVQAALALLAALPAAAQQPPAERILEVETPLQQAIEAQLQVYRDGGRPEVLKTSNALVYPFGVYQPVLSCTVLRICIIELQAGEQLQSLGVGDNVRWLIDHGTTGPQGQTIYISVVPTDYNLTTNLVVSTNRRMYHITLDSPPRQQGPEVLNPLEAYTRSVRFYYPDQLRVVESAEESGIRGIGVALDKLNYRYSWRAADGFPWEPLAVFDDGTRVFIRVPDDASGGAVLMLGSERDGRVANYLIRDGYFIVERVFAEARLIMPGAPAKKWFWQRRRQRQHVLEIKRDL